MSNADDYEWDETKRAANIAKHGVDFADVVRFDWAGAVLGVDQRQIEPRMTALGAIDDRLMVLIYVARGDRTRIISLRKADPHERRFYRRAWSRGGRRDRPR